MESNLQTETPDKAAGPDSMGRLRRPIAKEAALLMVLAVAGSALKVPFEIWFRPFFRYLDLYHRLVLLVGEVVLVCIVPFALRLNSELGLAGAPFIEAKLAGEAPPWRLRRLIKIAVLYDLASIGAGGLAAAAMILSGVLPLHGVAATAPHGGLPPPLNMLSRNPGRFAGLSAPAAVGAGVSEEILFRLSLFAISIWLFRLLLGERAERPSRTVLWCATFMQGYAFGLLHLLAGPAVLTRMKAPILVGALLAPQTWLGIILGRLYLRHGLEAAIIAHTMFDLGDFALVTLILYVVELVSHAH